MDSQVSLVQGRTRPFNPVGLYQVSALDQGAQSRGPLPIPACYATWPHVGASLREVLFRTSLAARPKRVETGVCNERNLDLLPRRSHWRHRHLHRAGAVRGRLTRRPTAVIFQSVQRDLRTAERYPEHKHLARHRIPPSSWQQQTSLTRIFHNTDTRPRLYLGFKRHFLQSAAIVDTAFLHKIPCKTNILPDHRMNS